MSTLVAPSRLGRVIITPNVSVALSSAAGRAWLQATLDQHDGRHRAYPLPSSLITWRALTVVEVLVDGDGTCPVTSVRFEGEGTR